ncbi:MAG: hypothetical protein WCC53_08465 [Thermoanaerobaculia bacterium]
MPICAHPAPRRTGSALLAASLLLLLGAASPAAAQALVKVNDNINFKLGFLIQPQMDWQETANATKDASAGYQQNILLRRIRFLIGGQVAKNLFFFAETENINLGKSTQAVGATAGAKSPGTGFSLLDAAGEWRIAKEFNIQFGEIRSPVSREGLKSSPNQLMLDLSAYAFLASTALQNQSGRDTGVMLRGWFFCDRLEYRSAIFGGFRQPGVKNSPRFVERLQYNFFDTEVYNMPSYLGVNYGNKKILAVGAAFDTQGDYRFGSADLYLDVPVGVGSFESTVQYQYANGGKFLTSLPEQSTFQVEAGVYIKKIKLAPVVRYEQKTFTQAALEFQNENRYAVGLNYYPYPKSESNFNIKFWWQRVGTRCATNANPCPATPYATNQFTVQMQAYYF